MSRSTQPDGVDTLGPYHLEEQLGRGAMGEVYLASTLDGSHVAVKVIRDELVRDIETRRRFTREARAAARLSHPNIARLLDFGVHSGRPFMAVELADAGTLADWRSHPPDADALLRAFHAILDALAHAHARGIIHRDLKPENVLLAREPSGATTPKLMDFGVVHFRDDVLRESEPNQMLGTPAYMSPEQAMQLADVTPASDLYAVGVMLFELLTGELPYVAKSSAGTILALMNEPIPDVVLRSGYSSRSDWTPLMRRFLAKDPADRFGLAIDARRALAGMTLNGVPSSSSHGPAGMRPSAWATAQRGTSSRTDHPTALRNPDPSEFVGTPSTALAEVRLVQLREVAFRGRRAELDRIRSVIRDARRGRGGVVLLSGEIGVGKSRILAELREQLETQGQMLVWDGVFDGQAEGPNNGLLLAIRRGLGIATIRGAALQKRVSAILTRLGIDDGWERTALAELLGATPSTPEASLLSREQTRWALIERLLQRVARERPVLLALDDVHLSDGTVLRFLEWMRRTRHTTRPWAVVATFRSESVRAASATSEALRALVDADDGSRLIHIELPRLGLRVLQSIVRDALPIDVGLADIVAMRAGGNPMFAVELVRHLVESGRLDEEGSAPTPEELLTDIPEAVGSLLSRRIEEAGALSDDDGTSLDAWERLAFLGLRFPLALAHTLLRAHTDESTAQGVFERALTSALVSGVLVEESNDVLRFENALLRDALLDRAAHHGRSVTGERDAARAKEQHFAGELEAYAFDVARHLERAGEVDDALRHYLRAGRHAHESLRPTAALDAWRAAQAMADAGATAGDEARIEALLGQAEAHLRLASYDDAERAALLARRIASLSRRPAPAEASRLLAEAARHKGDIRQARSLYEGARQAFERDGDGFRVALAAFGLGQLELRDGRLQEAEGRFRDARARFRALGHAEGAAAALRELGRTAFATGLYEEAQAMGSEARDASRAADDRQGAALAAITLGEVAGALDDRRAALDHFEQARDELVAIGDAHSAALATLASGSLDRGHEPERARTKLEEAWTHFRDLGDRQHAAIAALLLATLDAEATRWDAATPRIEEALERDGRERIDDPRFVAALVDVARLAIFGGQIAIARRLLQTATWKLGRTAHESPLYDRVDEVQYLLSELGEESEEEPTASVDWWDADEP